MTNMFMRLLCVQKKNTSRRAAYGKIPAVSRYFPPAIYATHGKLNFPLRDRATDDAPILE
ncbi:MAG: hypothetical protein LBJ59_09980 [Zoogloeaceae bacterium]|nr:hypothetical protein [Zoogloeaceae bacterium]